MRMQLGYKLLESCLEHIEKCSEGIGLVACLFPPVDIAIYGHFIDQSKPCGSRAGLTSHVTSCAAFLSAVLGFTIQSRIMRFSFFPSSVQV